MQGGEVLTVLQRDTGRDLRLQTSEVFPINRGTTSMYRFRATAPETGQQYALVHKNLSREGLKQSDAVSRPPSQKFYDSWKLLTDAGIKTVPYVWIASDDEVVMPDITSDGSRLYGKSELGELRKQNRALDEKDTNFAKIDFEAVKTETERLIQLATEREIVISPDDPFELRVKPDGTWEVIALDIELVRKENISGEAEHINPMAGRTFIKSLELMKNITSQGFILH
jgi:hypothetical protein